MNLYGYVGNDPVNATDPNGEELLPITTKAGKSGGNVFVLPRSRAGHAASRHRSNGTSNNRFVPGVPIDSYEGAAGIAAATISQGEQFDQPRGNSLFRVDAGIPIGENGETNISVTTRPLSEIGDLLLQAEVGDSLAAEGIVIDPTLVQVVLTIVPDDGSMLDPGLTRVEPKDDEE